MAAIPYLLELDVNLYIRESGMRFWSSAKNREGLVLRNHDFSNLCDVYLLQDFKEMWIFSCIASYQTC